MDALAFFGSAPVASWVSPRRRPGQAGFR